jgi:hypothetical protein
VDLSARAAFKGRSYNHRLTTCSNKNGYISGLPLQLRISESHPAMSPVGLFPTKAGYLIHRQNSKNHQTALPSTDREIILRRRALRETVEVAGDKD